MTTKDSTMTNSNLDYLIQTHELRRCLVCSNQNPCKDHSSDEQHKELMRSCAAFDKALAEKRRP